MPFFDGAGGRVYYRHWDREAPVAGVVFLHGFGEHTGLYHRYAAELGAHGITVWALDEVGHGLTAGERGQFGSLPDLTNNARTLVGLARHSAPDLPLVVAGHSLGSLVALLLALEAPQAVRGVVISGAPLSPVEWVLAAAADPGAGEIDLDPAALSSDPFYLDALENDPLAFTSADVGALLGAALPPAWSRLERDLPGLSLPVLAVHGSKDEIAPVDGVRAWVGRLPGLRLEVVDDAGHDVLNETQHRRVADTIGAFVLDLVPATQGR